MVDPGHGGGDPGAIVGGIEEKDINMLIAERMVDLSARFPRIEIALTRTGDYGVSLLDRIELAEEVGACCYLSVHANSYGDPAVEGAETFLAESSPRNEKNLQLARTIQRALVAETGAKDRGTRSRRLYTRWISAPAVLVETGFLTSPAEKEKLTDPNYQKKIALGLLKGLDDFIGRYVQEGGSLAEGSDE